MNPPAEILAWDSSFFELTVARVRGSRLDPDGYRRLMDWARSNDVDWLYFLADPDDPGTAAVARVQGLDPVDIRVTLGREIDARMSGPGIPAGAHFRPAVEADLPILTRLASRLHVGSRMFADSNVPRERATALYATWIENSLRGDFAEHVIVAEIDGGVCGYITGRREPCGHGSIGLMGVGSAARGRGVGTALIQALLVRLAERGISRVEVVTQGANIAAQRVYRRCGFVTMSRQIWYHIWLT